MAVIGKLAVQLSANTSGLQRGMAKAREEVSAFSKVSGRLASAIKVGVAAAFGVATVAVTKFGFEVKQQFESIDQMAKAADKLGLTTEKMAGLQLGASLAGIETDALSSSMRRMVNNVSEAASGVGEAKDAIKELGLDAGKLNAMSADQQLTAFADAFAKVANQSDKVRLATDIFGGRGTDMLNLLQDGSDALRQAQRDAERFGLAIGRDAAGKVEEANDAITLMHSALQGLARTFAVDLAPAITKAANAMTRMIDEFNRGKAGGLFAVNVRERLEDRLRLFQKQWIRQSRTPASVPEQTVPDASLAPFGGTGIGAMLQLIGSGMSVYDVMKDMRERRRRFERDSMMDAGPRYAEFQQTQLGRVGAGVSMPKKPEVKVDQMPQVLERLGQMIGILRMIPYAPARAG